MSERQHFLKLLQENEDDVETRLIYADWLEEQGEPEEAERQRKWPAAKKWLVNLCDEFNPKKADFEEWFDDAADFEAWDFEGEHNVIGFQRLLEIGLDAQTEMDLESFGNNEDLMWAVHERLDEFWQNWSIVTGFMLDKADRQRYFRCSC